MRRLASAAALSLLAAAAIITACADSDDGAQAIAPAPADDSSIAARDGSATDAHVEASATDASATADRICSDDLWCHTDPPPKHSLLDAWGDGQGNLWAASVLNPGDNDEHGGIARFDGKTWKQHYEEPKAKLVAIWGASPTDLFAGGPSGLIHGDGATWTPVALENGFQVEDITGSAASGVWVVGTNPLATDAQARVFHRAPGATTWSLVAIQAPDAGPDAVAYAEVRSAWIVPNGDLWMCARSGRDFLLRRRVAESTWSVVPTPTEPFQFTGVGPVASDPWIFGFVLFKGGAKYWNAKAAVVADAGDWTVGRWKGTDPSSDQIRRFAVWGLGPNDLWAGGAFALLEHWNGATWTTAKTSVDDIPIADDVLTFWGTTNDDLWAVGGRTALHKVSKAEAAILEADHAARVAKDGGP